MCAGDARGDKKRNLSRRRRWMCIKTNINRGKAIKKGSLCGKKRVRPRRFFFVAPDKREIRNHPSSHSINRSLARQVLVI